MNQTPEQMLRQFHAAAGLVLPSQPTFDISAEFVTDDIRQKMLDSEIQELRAAVAARDLVALADALADAIYVLYGTGVTHGLPMDKILAEVHRSNMTKFLPDGPVIDQDGKIAKGPGYEPPRLRPILGLPNRLLGRGRHTCHAPGCDVEVPPRMFMCRKHWFMLTKALRAAIWATYRPGQEVTKDPSPAYLEAAFAARQYIAEREGTHGGRKQI